jgi:hypothetical protein
MIHFLLVQNRQGKTRLAKWYTPYDDVEKRKLTYLVADDHIGTLSIKGTTIIGFDSTKSQTKTVRKPQDIIKKLMTAGKPASRKVFSELTTVSTMFSGRTNDNIIILKAY